MCRVRLKLWTGSHSSYYHCSLEAGKHRKEAGCRVTLWPWSFFTLYNSFPNSCFTQTVSELWQTHHAQLSQAEVMVLGCVWSLTVCSVSMAWVSWLRPWQRCWLCSSGPCTGTYWLSFCTQLQQCCCTSSLQLPPNCTRNMRHSFCS